VLNIWRLAENVSGVPGLRHLNDHGLLQIKYVFILENVHGPRTFIEMPVVVRVVVGAPVDLCDIKIARQTLIPAEPAQFITFGRNFLDVGAQMVDLFPVLAKARVPCAPSIFPVRGHRAQWVPSGWAAPFRDARNTVLAGVRKQEISLDLEAIKQALNLEKEVEGADLALNRFKLQVIWGEDGCPAQDGQQPPPSFGTGLWSAHARGCIGEKLEDLAGRGFLGAGHLRVLNPWHGDPPTWTFVRQDHRKSYGFRTYRVLELALYHSLGKLPEPESTHDFFWRPIKD
jgi:hypothetical protein